MNQLKPTRQDTMRTLAKEYDAHIITSQEALYLHSYCAEVHPLLAPPSVWWNGAIADWHQLHCSYGLMGELLELENETNIVPLVKEFGDVLFYLINLIESTNSWRDFNHMFRDDLVFDGDFYCHLNNRACLIRHVDVLCDLVKRKIFYGNAEIDTVELTRHIISALTYLKMGYISCMNSYEDIYNRLLASSATEEEKLHWTNVFCAGDDTIFTEDRSLITLANRNLNKLLKGKNARYAGGKFSLEDSIAKKDSVEDGKSVPNPEASL